MAAKPQYPSFPYSREGVGSIGWGVDKFAYKSS